MRVVAGLLGALVLSACGPAGELAGRVTVEGGSPAGVAVIIYGPQSAATVTADDGAFSVKNLPDGKYVVRATVRGADVEELSVATTITNMKADPEPVLAFKASVAKVTGRVVFADGSGPENLTVTAVGPETRGARTSPDGSFSFEGLKAGAYLLSVEAKDTREGRVSVGVNASGTVDAGELRLTPVGRLSGTVVFNAMPVEGVPVMVAGTSLTAVSDAMGRFSFVDVPTGQSSLHAKVGSEPFFRSATELVMVVRGTNPDVTLTLSDDAPKTGTVNGLVTFRGPRSPRDISISVPGAGVTGTPLVNGSFSLTVPVGVWDVFANAPQHPRLLLGRVAVSAQQVVVLPGAELSWYRPLWTSSSPLTSLSSFFAPNEAFGWTLTQFNDGGSGRFGLVNAGTGELRILGVGSLGTRRFSRLGKYFGWAVNETLFIYELATGGLTTIVDTTNITNFDFSSDETLVFVARTGATLTRTPINAPTMGTVFPATGVATSVVQQSRDRWFLREGPDYRLVTTTLDVPQVFTNVSTFSTTPTAWALTNCGLNCQLQVLAPTASMALVVPGITPPPGGVFALGQSRGELPCFNQGTTGFCVRASDATVFPLPANVNTFLVNEAGDRAIYTFNQGTTRLVREEALPPSSATMNLGSSTSNWGVAWLSPTRAIAWELGGASRTIHLVKTTGATTTVTTENDVGTQGTIVAAPLVIFPQQSTSRWRAIIGDGPVRAIDVPTTEPVSSLGVRSYFQGEPLTRYASVGFDSVNQYLIDENQGNVRFRGDGYCGSGYRSGTTEFCLISRSGGSQALFTYQTGAVAEYDEPGLASYNFTGSGPTTTGIVALSADRRTVLLGSMSP